MLGVVHNRFDVLVAGVLGEALNLSPGADQRPQG